MFLSFLLLNEAIASRAVIVIVSGLDWWTEKAFGVSKITQERQEIDFMSQWGASGKPWAAIVFPNLKPGLENSAFPSSAKRLEIDENVYSVRLGTH